jgi:3-oxoadipate CoA-transferase, beta subunit
VWVIMEHNTRKGGARLVETCTLPLTGKACVKRIYTDLAVVDVTPAGFLVRELVEGLSREELQKRSAARLAFATDCRPLSAPALPDAE